MFKVSAVPPRRSAMLTVFRGATAINDGTTAEPLLPWRCNYGLCRTSTAVAPCLRCDGGRRSAVMTILWDATAINDGTTAIMAVSLRNHGDNGGATAVYAVQALQWYRASGVTGVLHHSSAPTFKPRTIHWPSPRSFVPLPSYRPLSGGRPIWRETALPLVVDP